MNLFKEGIHLRGLGVNPNVEVLIDIPINAKVTLLKDDRASGKTLMLKNINKMLRCNDVTYSNVDTSTIKVLLSKEAFDYFVKHESNIENHIIFIDKFDRTDFKESIPFIRNSNNYFIICAHRTLPSCGQEADSILEMHSNGGVLF